MPGRRLLVAVDRTGQALSYDGTKWGTARLIDPESVPLGGLSALSCSGPTFCVAVDPNGYYLTYDGSAWAPPDALDLFGGGLSSVSCPRPGACVAVDMAGYAMVSETG